MKSAIISGATGNIGVALTNELIKNNVKVLLICQPGINLDHIPKSNLIKTISYDLSNFKSIENSANETYEVFYHLAWAGTTGNDRNDLEMQEKNVEYSLDAVHLAKKFGCKTFVGAGSQAEYGRPTEVLSPTTPTNPENNYGIAKLKAGIRTKEMCDLLDIKHIWVRIASVFGPYGKNIVSNLVDYIIDNEDFDSTEGIQIWNLLYSSKFTYY